MATINLGRVKPVFQGAYSGATAYVVDDIVTHDGNSYICILASTGNAPTNATYWHKMAAGSDLGGLSGLTAGDIAVYNGSAWVRQGVGTAGQALKVNSSANGLEFGDAGKIKAMDRFALTGLSSLSATTAETYFWSVTYNRQNNGDLWIVSDIPASELPNGPYVAPHLQIVCGGTTIRASRGLKWFRPNTDNTELGFNSYFTAAELGSFTGNITIKHGWNWGGATSATKPLGYINLAGTSGVGNQQLDSRVPNSGSTEGHMMVMEF